MWDESLNVSIHDLTDTGSIVSKSGHKNVSSISVPDRLWRYMDDIYTTLVDIKWRWNLLIFFGVFVISWLVFAAFYILLSSVHGDLEVARPDDWKPCVTNIRSFASAFLFSIETMTTIGYGYRYVTEACPGAYLGVFVQSIIGAALQIALAGLVVAKIRRAKKRTNTILFSDVACIFYEDNKMRLAIRVGDMRKSDITAAHVRGILLQKIKSKKHGKHIPVSYFSVAFKSEGGSEQLFLPWPTFVIHDIDDMSPLWEVTRDDLMMENFELIVMLEGVDSSTNMSFQAKKAYKPWDIQWGRRFHGLGIVTDYVGENYVRFELFHATFPVDTPHSSARETAEIPSRPPSIAESDKRERRISVAESVESIFRRRKSITDTFLGPEFDDVRGSRSPSLRELGRERKISGTESIHSMMKRRKGEDESIFRRRKSITDTFLGPEFDDVQGCRSPSLRELGRERKISGTESIHSMMKRRKGEDARSPSLSGADRRRKISKTSISSIFSRSRSVDTFLGPEFDDCAGRTSPASDVERQRKISTPDSASSAIYRRSQSTGETLHGHHGSDNFDDRRSPMTFLELERERKVSKTGSITGILKRTKSSSFIDSDTDISGGYLNPAFS